MNLKPSKKIKLHFVGIGGIGMSGIAEVLYNQGYEVSGSDTSRSDTVVRLENLGISVYEGHDPQNVVSASVVVVSSAISTENPEVQNAKKLGIPVIPRAEMLGELMRGKTGIAVAGTHGKTTVTSMVATVFSKAGLDPTAVIGGKVDYLGGNAKLGKSDYVIAEADESDGSFLHLPATFGIITNIDNDHFDFFGKLEALENAFVEFASKIPFYGLSVVCGDDPGVQRVIKKITKPTITYGLNEKNRYRASDVKQSSKECRFSFTKDGKVLCQTVLRVPGIHNVQNALGAMSLACEVGISPNVIAQGIEEFQGVSRRFEVCYLDSDRRRAVVDDYAHHPTEIQATLDAARSFWKDRIVTVFQPHRFSRTLNCRDGFLNSFHESDVVLISDIYPAGEKPIDGVSSKQLVEDLKKHIRKNQQVQYIGDLDVAKSKIVADFRDGDLILCLGAGSITKLASEVSQLARTTGD